MKTILQKYWADLFASYWFLPSVMAISAMALAFGVASIDETLNAAWIGEWATANTAEGARTLLSTVAGSMIGVAGVTFSITIVCVVHASGQYGPRVLTAFMSDRGNQVTLGTFIATFLYCLMVLRTVQSGGDSGDAFVPHLSVLTAVVLTVCSTGVLIYFIHHVPQSIHVSNVTARVGHEILVKVESLFPEKIGERLEEEAEDEVTLPDEAAWRDALCVPSPTTGYVQAIDEEGLLTAAKEADTVVRVVRRPGNFAARGDTLVKVLARTKDDEALREQLSGLFVIGSMRTAFQDARYLVRQLVEIAARALSPGMNDPRTAMQCVDWMGATLKVLAQRRMPGSHRVDEAGELRVIAEPTSYEDFLAESFGQLRPYLATDPNAAAYGLEVLGEILDQACTPGQRDLLTEEARHLMRCSEELLQDSPALVERVRSRFDEVFGGAASRVG